MLYNMQRKQEREKAAKSFGAYIRQARERLQAEDAGGAYSLRAVASQVGMEPGYLSRVERDEVAPPSEPLLRGLAQALHEDPDVLMATAGKVSAELQQIILRRPALFAELLRQLERAPEHAVLRVVRQVRDGNW